MTADRAKEEQHQVEKKDKSETGSFDDYQMYN